MDNLSIKYDVPSFYLIDAKIYPKDMNYSMEVAKYSFKEDLIKTTVNHDVDGKIKGWHDDVMFNQLKKDGIALILYKHERYSIIKQNFFLF